MNPENRPSRYSGAILCILRNWTARFCYFNTCIMHLLLFLLLSTNAQ